MMPEKAQQGEDVCGRQGNSGYDPEGDGWADIPLCGKWIDMDLAAGVTY